VTIHLTKAGQNIVIFCPAFLYYISLMEWMIEYLAFDDIEKAREWVLSE
jgi:hypothetical protein